MIRIPRSLSATVVTLILVLVPAALAGDGLSSSVDIRGTVSELTVAEVTVRNEERDLTCARRDRSPALEGVAVGDRIAILCTKVDAVLVLAAWKRVDEVDQISVKGHIAELADGSIVVQGEKRVACTIGEGSPQVEKLVVGDVIAMVCKRVESEYRLVGWKRIGEGYETRMLEIGGAVTEVTDASITVTNREHGRRLTCRITAKHAGMVSEIRVGDRAKMLCARRGTGKPVLLKLKRLESAERGQYVDIAGEVTANEAGSLTITQPDTDRSLTCKVPANEELAAFVAELRLGARAAMLCRDGVLVKVKLLEEPASPVVKEFLFYGEIIAIGGDRITVSTEAGLRSCLVPDELGASVAERTIGQRVKVLCKGKDLEHATLAAIAVVG